ncbi:ribonuclease H family protein [Neptunomonas antarctica]|uniref:Ribonuclease H n=1 Tax=Neptunomonas antarctica TaxID=619304 RepID=A0A1N7KWJ6_9GAMM|nr:ribonuclease H family protein [Neptunomonas antarctica]SIS66012.1 ribonuclease HI [Neptunomonas antarctica]
MKFYVVWKGRETGIFTDWNTCNKHVKGFAGAKYKSFKTRVEADAAFRGDSTTQAKAPGTGVKSQKATVQSPKTHTASEVSALKFDTKIFTDGGCVPNPGKAGSGVAVYRDEIVEELWYGLFNPQGTNNTAELNALFQALIMAKDDMGKGKSVAIFCDSKYSIQCVTQWAVGWKKNGWKKKSGEIQNLELIKEMFELHQSIKDQVHVLHVNGHVGVEGNELADRMSIVAIEAQESDFTRYLEDIDVEALLAMRAG